MFVRSLYHKATQLLFVANLWVLFVASVRLYSVEKCEQDEPCSVHCVLSICVASITRLAWFAFVYNHSVECLCMCLYHKATQPTYMALSLGKECQ